MITVEAQLSYDKLLEAVSQLSATDLEKFQAQIIKLRANKRDQSLPQQEAALLLKINNLISPKNDIRYQTLIAKRQNEDLTEAEYQDLLRLADQYEQQDFKRIRYLHKLAILRGISLTELMDRLEIP